MKYFIFFYISITILFSNKDRFLTPQNYNTWVIKEPALKELIYEEIEYFIKYNSEDSLNIIKSTDQFIIIESKKQRGVIYELRYGQDGKYQFIDKKLINWVLPEKLRTEIINKDYWFVSDQKYLNNLNKNFENEYFYNYFHWTNTNLYLSLGSSSPVNGLIYKPTKINGEPINSSNALSIRAGNDLIGYPNHSKGMYDIGLLSPNYEIGIQTPLLGYNKNSKNNYLEGGFGGYGKVLLLNQFQVQLSFSEMIEHPFLLDQITDSTFINFLNLSTFLGCDINFNKPIFGLGYLKGMLGAGYYEIAHRSLTNDEKIVERYKSKSGDPYDDSKSSFIGAIVRADLITTMKERLLPITHLYLQVNGYKGNSSWQSGFNFNIKSLGLDLIYKQSIDKVDWAPNQEVFISFNYSVNL